MTILAFPLALAVALTDPLPPRPIALQWFLESSAEIVCLRQRANAIKVAGDTLGGTAALNLQPQFQAALDDIDRALPAYWFWSDVLNACDRSYDGAHCRKARAYVGNDAFWFSRAWWRVPRVEVLPMPRAFED